MIESKYSHHTTVKNPHQKFILSQLITREHARFKDLKPPKIGSNAYSYHLKELQKGGWITKSEAGYCLGPTGLAHIERDIESKPVRMQPNVAVALVVQDGYGKILLHKKLEQPYINQWELPMVPAAVADISVREAGVWAAKALLRHVPDTVGHVGDCYIRVHKGKIALGSTLIHVIRFTLDDYVAPEGYAWVDPLRVESMPCAPGVERIMTRTFFNDSFFFEEFTVQLTTQEAFSI